MPNYAVIPAPRAHCLTGMSLETALAAYQAFRIAEKIEVDGPEYGTVRSISGRQSFHQSEGVCLDVRLVIQAVLPGRS